MLRISNSCGPSLNKIDTPFPLGLREHRKREVCGTRRWAKGCKSPFFRLNATVVIIKLSTTVSTCTGPTQDCPYQLSVKEEGGANEVPPFTSDLLAIDRFWERRNYSLCCVPSAEPTRLQQIAPNSWLYRQPWFISVGHRTKGIAMNTRESFVGRRGMGEVGGEVGLERSVCVVYMCIIISKQI